MACVTDNELIRLSGAELGSRERARIVAHLADCAECRSRQAALVQLAELLGHWNVDSTPHFVAARVRAAAANERAVPRAGLPGIRPAILVRFAAAAAIGAAIGLGLARAPIGIGPPLAGEVPATELALGLSALSIASPAGFSAALDEIYEGAAVAEERP